jgi:hypothetical protein
VIELRVRASPFPEVRSDAAFVEQVMMGGVNPVALRDHPALHATLDPARTPPSGLLVEQDLRGQRMRLLADATGPSLAPEVPLRGLLRIEVQGFSEPLTLCGAPRDLDPTPCVAATDVEVGSPLARLDESGTLHLREDDLAATAMDLARETQLEVPLRIGGAQLAVLNWPLRFKKPEDLLFQATASGARGPNLDVWVSRTAAGRFVYRVEGGSGTILAAVEPEDVAAFHVVSRGADGQSGLNGASGLAGSTGMDGISAMCPGSPGGSGTRGSDGGRGGDGQDGGPGGDGGDLLVHAPQDVVAAGFLQNALRSEGGRGGSGGAGGSGGRGGSGGSGGIGATCTDSNGQLAIVAGGGPGPSGSDGPSGMPGSDGRAGRPGRIRIGP